MAENNNIEIPENADKILFAKDLIRYVMLCNGSAPYSGWRSGPYRESIYKGFNETTEMAVRFLFSTMARKNCHFFHSLQINNAVNREIFSKLANDFVEGVFPSGYVASNFLRFCVQLATLAAKFYTNGVLEAPDLAVLYIVKPIQDIDMTTGGWDTVENVAQMYAIMAQDSMDKLSPEYVNSEEDAAGADNRSEGGRGVPEANYMIAVPGEANRHATENYTDSNEENGETQNYSMYDENRLELSSGSVSSEEDTVAADSGSEGDRDVPEANYQVEVPGEANGHAAEKYIDSNDENGETQNYSMYDENRD